MCCDCIPRHVAGVVYANFSLALHWLGAAFFMSAVFFLSLCVCEATQAIHYARVMLLFDGQMLLHQALLACCVHVCP